MTGTLDVTDGHLAFDETGEGPPVVLLHSGGTSRGVWDAQMPTLGRRFRTIRLDLRGHGQASTPTGPFAHHDDVAAALDALGIARTRVVGVSLGAGVAVDLALEHPGRVQQVVAVGAGVSHAVFLDPWALDVQRRLAAAAAAGDPQRWIDVDLEWFDGPHRRRQDVDPELRARFRGLLEQTITTHVAAAGPPRPVFVADPGARLAEISVPVLGVIGGLDAPDHHRMVRELVAGVPDGRMVTIADAAHHPMLETPAAFDAAVLPFLEGGG